MQLDVKYSWLLCLVLEKEKKWVREAFGNKRESFLCAGKSLSGECKGCGDINGERERSGVLFIEARNWDPQSFRYVLEVGQVPHAQWSHASIALKDPQSFSPYLIEGCYVHNIFTIIS